MRRPFKGLSSGLFYAALLASPCIFRPAWAGKIGITPKNTRSMGLAAPVVPAIPLNIGPAPTLSAILAPINSDMVKPPAIARRSLPRIAPAAKIGHAPILLINQLNAAAGEINKAAGTGGLARTVDMLYGEDGGSAGSNGGGSNPGESSADENSENKITPLLMDKFIRNPRQVIPAYINLNIAPAPEGLSPKKRNEYHEAQAQAVLDHLVELGIIKSKKSINLSIKGLLKVSLSLEQAKEIARLPQVKSLLLRLPDPGQKK